MAGRRKDIIMCAYLGMRDITTVYIATFIPSREGSAMLEIFPCQPTRPRTSLKAHPNSTDIGIKISGWVTALQLFRNCSETRAHMVETALVVELMPPNTRNGGRGMLIRLIRLAGLIRLRLD